MGGAACFPVGADVTVFTRSEAKADDALPPWRPARQRHHRQIRPRCSAPSPCNSRWQQYVELLKCDGTMALVGLPPHSQQPTLDIMPLVSMRRSVAGSMIGGIAETQEMLDFCGQRGITLQIEIIPIDSVNQAYDRVLSGDVRYRFVIDMASL